MMVRATHNIIIMYIIFDLKNIIKHYEIFIVVIYFVNDEYKLE